MSVAMISTSTSVTSSHLLWSSCTSLQLQSSSFFIGAAAGHDGIVGHFRVGAIWEPLFKPCNAYVTPWSYTGAQCPVHCTLHCTVHMSRPDHTAVHSAQGQCTVHICIYVTPWSYCGALRCDKDLFEVQGVEVLLQLNDIAMNQPLVIWYFVWDKVSEMWFDWNMYEACFWSYTQTCFVMLKNSN